MSYQLLLTNVGQQKLAAAASSGSPPVLIAQFAVGQGVNVDFSQRLDQQVLVSKRYQGAVESVSATAIAGQYEVTCVVPVNEGGWAIREMGLIDSDGDLIWVGRLPEVQKPAASSTSAVDYRLKAVIQIDNPDVTLVIDANIIMASQSWVANNFVSNPRFATFLALAYPYGYPYWSHSKTNPKPLFDAMFGFATHWRRLEGVGLVAVKDGDPYIGQPMINLGQRGTTELASSVRPHTYPVHTNYLFERYDPDTVVETVWNVIADKSSIAEGGAIRFTITANNLPDGQILDWNIAEGELNAASNNIDTPDNTAIGTVILSNGQAIIDYTTTADDNITEAQKHVRLNVGLPANLSINIAIDDKAFSEKSIHITESTTDGIDLAEYYKTQSGQYPSAQDTIRFIVDAGVDIIAASTIQPAVTEGENWPSSATAIIENRGRILGRGGNGGTPARYSQKINTDNANRASFMYALNTPSTVGSNGGTAIKGDIHVDNYGFIAGGGGGGGGGGIFYVAKTSTSIGYTLLLNGVTERIYVGGGGGSGGGAPFGVRYPNPYTVTEFLEKFNTTNADVPYDKQGKSLSVLLMQDGSATSSTSHGITNVSGDPTIKTDYPAIVCSETDVSHFKGERWTDANKNSYYVQNDTDAVRVHSKSASLDVGGDYGYDITEFSRYTIIPDNNQEVPLAKIMLNHGGAGGNIGEAGDSGVLDTPYWFDGSVPTGVLKTLPPSSGGLAGFIKEGNVIINNLTGGTTKGRTA